MGAVWSFMEYVLGIDSNSYEMKQRTYTDSNFRRLYKATPKQQTVESVLQGLKGLKNKSFAETFSKLAKQNPKIYGSDAEDVKKGIFFSVYISISI